MLSNISVTSLPLSGPSKRVGVSANSLGSGKLTLWTKFYWKKYSSNYSRKKTDQFVFGRHVLGHFETWDGAAT